MQPRVASNPGYFLVRSPAPGWTSDADVHDISGPHLQGLGIGIFICAVYLTAYGVGAPLIGKINDILGAATNPGMMRYGYLISPLACGLAALLLWLGSRSMNADNRDTGKT